MRTDIVFTLTGPDRVGVVEEVTDALLALGSNVEASRMARLGGEFAMLMLLSVPAEKVAQLVPALEHLMAQGYKVTTTLTKPAVDQGRPGWTPFRIEVQGADHEGIIHEIAQGLSERGINIESMETRTSPASVSGTPLFTMTALVIVPPTLAGTDWTAALEEAGHLANVDIEVSEAAG